MNRRARRHPLALPWQLFTLLALIGIGLGVYFLVQGGDPYRTIERLQPKDYLENSNSLRGNTYKLDGVIVHSLGWSPERGRLFSLNTADGDEDCPLPILVPADFRDLNIQKGQRYQIKVHVNENGLLQVEEMNKS